jgi:hypothetical protein
MTAHDRPCAGHRSGPTTLVLTTAGVWCRDGHGEAPPDEVFRMQCGPGAALQPDRPAHHGAARYRAVAMSLRTDRLEAARLEQLVRASEWFMGVLDAARACGAPDCWVGAGAQRDLVWDRLHGGFVPERVKDVDVAFFDPQDLRPERDQAVEDELVQLLPWVRWDAKNQAAVHPWYERRFGVPVQPLGSTADGVATWPETATAVALQLRRDGRLAILAPCGLSDLLHGVCRRNPAA